MVSEIATLATSVVVEFAASSAGAPRWRLGHGGRHGHLPSAEVARVLGEAGLAVLDSGSIGLRGLHYSLARPT